MSATPRAEAEASARIELARALDVCGSCRRCVPTCAVFPSLVNLLDATPSGAGDMTPDEQDALVDACTSCGRCVAECPYAPGLDPRAVDVAAALRAVAVAGRVGQRVAFASILGARGARWLRVRRESWRRGPRRRVPTAAVADADTLLVLTCGVERRPEAVRAIVDELGRSGRTCAVVRPAACCGAELFTTGRLGSARRVARRVVSRLVTHARRGTTLVVAEPTCLRTIAVEYPRALGSDTARIVADAAIDPCAAIDPSAIDVSADDEIDYLVPCHVHPTRANPAAVDLLRAAGLRVRAVSGCAPGGPSASAQVAECEHADGSPHPLQVLARLRR